MGDESMARNLDFQARAIWPQEQRLFQRYQLEGAFKALDVGCGTGEITLRLAELFPEATLLGVDILPGNLALAERALAVKAALENDAAPGSPETVGNETTLANRPGLESRVNFREADAFALPAEDGSFDLVVCRHLSQAVPDFPGLLAELCRVLAPGGHLHLLSEDYGMLHMPHVRDQPDLDRFWVDVALPYLESIQCDGRVGRHSLPLVRARGLEAARIDYVTVDSERVPRRLLAGIFEAWRDGYTEPLAAATGRQASYVAACFQGMIDAAKNPEAYLVWQVPIISARKPTA